MTTAIIQALAYGLGIFFVYYASKKAHQLLQWWRDIRTKQELEESIKNSQEMNQKANKESDDLRKIDGR